MIGERAWGADHYWEVAAFWPGEGYGGTRSFDDEAGAMAWRDVLLAKGYKQVHVREVTTRVVKLDAVPGAGA
jgi:hypothetical protein